MSLAERYYKKSDAELLEVVEAPSEYTQEAVDMALEVLRDRGADEEKMRYLALARITKICRAMVEDFSVVSNEKLVPPSSNILGKDEVLAILKQEFEELMARRDDMRPDGWMYAIGGG